MSAVLIAGPLIIEDIGQTRGFIGGAGGYAAIAAAPLGPTQLWTQAGSGFPQAARTTLENHHVDLAGVAFDGISPIDGGSCLPEVEPTSAEDLGAALLIALPPGDLRRAIAVIARLAKPPVLVIAPPHGADSPLLDACAQAADVIVMPLPAALVASGTDDALTAGLAIRARGAKAVVLTAGMLGGIIVYGDKTVTYPAMPLARSASPGTGAAFAGALAAWCAGEGADFRGIKRGCAMASAVGGICDQGVGPKKLLSVGRKEYVERFNRLRRTNKF